MALSAQIEVQDAAAAGMVAVWLFDVSAAVLLAGTALIGKQPEQPAARLHLQRACSSSALHIVQRWHGGVTGAYMPVILARKGQAAGQRSLSFVLGNMLSAGGKHIAGPDAYQKQRWTASMPCYASIVLQMTTRPAC